MSPEQNNDPSADDLISSNPQPNVISPGSIPSQPSATPNGLPPNTNGQVSPGSPPPTPAASTIPSVPWDNPSMSSAVPPKKSRRKLYIGMASALVLVGLSLGVVFGYFIPNKPENVYRTGMERSGQAIDKIIENATTKDKLEQIKKSEIDGLLEFEGDEGKFNGTFNVKLDPTKSDSRLDLKIKESGQPEQSFGLKVLTEMPEAKRFPNIYFQLSGLQTLQLDAFVPGLSEYEGKWIAVGSDYLESLGSGFIPPAEKANKENISSEEVSHLIKTISDVNNEYLFTGDPDKAVLENREYLGKETTDEGIKAFHYKVGINKDHFIAYCKAISDKVLSEPAAKKIADMDDRAVDEAKKSAAKDCDDSRQDIKDDETFDMWVDAKYKVIHKVRAYSDKNKKDAYTDFGQIYTGGEKMSLFMKYHEDKDNLNVKFTLDVDVATNNSKAEVSGGQEGSNKLSGRASISAQPYSGEINVTQPAGTISIEEVLKKFGFDPSGVSGIEPVVDQQLIQRCIAAEETRANNRGQTTVPAECDAI